MDILTSQLPSGGYGYTFPTISLSPMNFMEICNYIENAPKDPLARYMYDIKNLIKEDKNISDCYLMDLDFLIFYKKLCTVSENLTYELSVVCPDCGKTIKKSISFEKDIHFKQVDTNIMSGANINLGGHKYEVEVPTVKDFLKVFEVYFRYKKTNDLKLIKTISLIKGFEYNGNQIEKDVLKATHEDVTLLLALQELYFDQLEPIKVFCNECNSKKEEGRSMAVSVSSLIVDFFRDLCINSPIDGSKILFK